jgi:HTH-type transcriptional regulator / antitoxin HigA
MRYKTIEDIKNAREVISCPGDTLMDIINFKGMPQTELALRMGRPIKTINEIIMGKAAITPETALQLERVVGPSASFWLERERLYRLDLAEIKESEILLESLEWVALFPLNDMLKLQWIKFENDIISKINALLRFFSVANKESFNEYYFNNLYPALFRISVKDTKNPYAIISWLRRGDIQAESIKVPAYDIKKFKKSLPEIKQLMAEHPAGFFQKLQTICLTCGVKVVSTPCLPKAPIQGATRWQNENPIIQLTGRYNRNDIFWFTFFHEAGHIVKHGKRDIYVEGLGYTKEELLKEKEADEFAIKYTLSAQQEAELKENLPLTKKSIMDFAIRFNTHPALIIGRFARENKELNKLGWSLKYFQSIDLSLS